MLRQVIEAHELLDDAGVNGEQVAKYLHQAGLENVKVERATTKEGYTDFIKVFVPGKTNITGGSKDTTLGIIGRLGGIGARPDRVGLVSDADGAITAIACALKLAEMNKRGDSLLGNVIVATHICPCAPTVPHEPVAFMGCPVSMAQMNKFEVDERMQAILSIDTTKGNRIANFRSFAITPTVKEGYILKVSDDLVSIMEWTTGEPARVIAITTQDITPYENGLSHMNSIMQPCTVTNSPVTGVAITTETPVPGCATGANHETDIEAAARYCIEVAKAFSQNKCSFYTEEEFQLLVRLYGPMHILQSPGK